MYRTDGFLFFLLQKFNCWDDSLLIFYNQNFFEDVCCVHSHVHRNLGFHMLNKKGEVVMHTQKDAGVFDSNSNQSSQELASIYLSRIETFLSFGHILECLVVSKNDIKTLNVN